MIAVCKGCNKAVNEDETSMCIHCLGHWCNPCIYKRGIDCACQQALNQILDAEEAAAASRIALTVN